MGRQTTREKKYFFGRPTNSPRSGSCATHFCLFFFSSDLPAAGRGDRFARHRRARSVSIKVRACARAHGKWSSSVAGHTAVPRGLVQVCPAQYFRKAVGLLPRTWLNLDKKLSFRWVGVLLARALLMLNMQDTVDVEGLLQGPAVEARSTLHGHQRLHVRRQGEGGQARGLLGLRQPCARLCMCGVPLATFCVYRTWLSFVV